MQLPAASEAPSTILTSLLVLWETFYSPFTEEHTWYYIKRSFKALASNVKFNIHPSPDLELKVTGTTLPRYRFAHRCSWESIPLFPSYLFNCKKPIRQEFPNTFVYLCRRLRKAAAMVVDSLWAEIEEPCVHMKCFCSLMHGHRFKNLCHQSLPRTCLWIDCVAFSCR